MIEMTGNIFTTSAPAIGHGVNCQGRMGAGIAVQFRTLFPEMYRQYKAVCDAGHLQPGDVFVFDTPNFTIYNIASQHLPGSNAQLDWLEDGLRASIMQAEDSGFDRIAIPQIGCGIGGLSVSDVVPLVKDVESGTSVQFEWWTYQA